ncbi:hypothetical protein [Polyangium mundeleinium]|uniref:SnoaL-like domain-containing protein n=1 Tax=Polyangium mundeleinium TaxID=2995306 RepID=A0ABT5EU86_9BACT|nr:hypothetical protein [Polyangium mundeleinium]MDC0745341.1 hypothetical protein [Polyangium mundeleinium]
MTANAQRNLQLAQQLLDWNRRNLRHDVALTPALIAERFAPRFTVFANGRSYAADHGNDQRFLEGFKATIASIDYRIHETGADDAGVVLAMRATVRRVHGATDLFDAMLLLRFDEAGQVALWHEVDVRSESEVVGAAV